MMFIFWDKDSVLLTKYLSRGIIINGPYYALIIEWPPSVILEKRRSKLSCRVLFLRANTSVHKCNIVQAALRRVAFTKLDYPAYSLDIAPSDYYLFSNLKKFLHGKNFSSDDEAITTVVDYLIDLNSEFFCKGTQSLHDRWPGVVASKGQYIQ